MVTGNRGFALNITWRENVNLVVVSKVPDSRPETKYRRLEASKVSKSNGANSLQLLDQSSGHADILQFGAPTCPAFLQVCCRKCLIGSGWLVLYSEWKWKVTELFPTNSAPVAYLVLLQMLTRTRARTVHNSVHMGLGPYFVPGDG